MQEHHNQRLVTGELDGARRDADKLIEMVVAGDDHEPFLAGMPEFRRDWVKKTARPMMDYLHFHAVRVVREPAFLDKVPFVVRVKVRRYADTLIRRHRDRSSES